MQTSTIFHSEISVLYSGELIFLPLQLTVLFIIHLAKPLSGYPRKLWKTIFVNIILLSL